MGKFKTTQQKQAQKLVVSPLNDASSDWLLYSSEFHSKYWDGLFEPGPQGMTPPLIVKRMVETVLSIYYKSANKPPKILDPCSGSGSFLFCAFFNLCVAHDVETFEIFKKCIHVWDNDEKKINLQQKEWIKLLVVLCPEVTHKDIETVVKKNIIVNNALNSYNDSMTNYDIILGNLPFNFDSIAKKKPWTAFALQAIRGGASHVMFVTPSAWAYGEKREVSEVRNALSSGLCLAELNASQYFPKIAEDISFWLWQKDFSGKTAVITRRGKAVEHDFKARFVEDDNKIFSDIEKKVMFRDEKLKLESCNFKKDTLSKIQSSHFQYNIQYSASQLLFSHDIPKDYFLPKVFINRSGHYWIAKTPEKYVRYMPAGTAGSLARYVVVNNESEAKNLVQILHSKLFILLVQMNPTKNIQFKDDIHRLPKMDVHRSWTDDELYQHFGLTKEEITYVELMIDEGKKIKKIKKVK